MSSNGDDVDKTQPIENDFTDQTQDILVVK